MIEPTDEMVNAVDDVWVEGGNARQAAAAVLAIAEPKIRRDVAEEIARAIEIAQGIRCPDCHGLAASVKWRSYVEHRRCGGGHTWQARHGQHAAAAAVARSLGRLP